MAFLIWLWYYLWVAPYVLLASLFASMYYRRLYRDFPVFFAYAGFEVVQFAVLFGLARRPSTTANLYFVLYCVSLAMSTALRFGILHEIFGRLFGNYTYLNKFRAPLFRWGTTGLLVFSLAVAVATGGNSANHQWFLLNTLNRSVLILQAGLLLGMFLFSRYLNLSWRNPVFGIALGFGIFALAELAVAAVRSEMGFRYTRYLDYPSMAAYHVCVLLWGYYLLVPERIPPISASADGLPEHAEVESWNHELERLLR